MKSEESGMVTERAGSSVRIEHRPSKPWLNSASDRGESGGGNVSSAHRLPPKPKHHTILLRGRPLEERFRALVGPKRADGCQYWLGRLDRDGYGRIQCKGEEFLVHRVALELKLGRGLSPWEATRHLCNVRLCVAPAHLIPGSWEENAADTATAGRTARGPTKLSDAQVEEIRRRRAAGEPGTKLGIEFGVSNRLIYYIEHRAKRARATPVPEGYFVKALRCPGGFRATARGTGFEETAEAPTRGDAIRAVLAKVERLVVPAGDPS